MRWILYLSLVTSSEARVSCSHFKDVSPKLDFHLTFPCSYSSANVIASSRVKNVNSCKDFASRRRAFAFNFLAHGSMRGAKDLNATCLAFDCPIFNQNELSSPSPYDYYTVFPQLPDSQALTCLPGMGIFLMVMKPLQHSIASLYCESVNGRLVDVSSQRNTDEFSRLLSKHEMHWAYVDLTNKRFREDFTTSKGFPLSCTGFRAWATGEPRIREAHERCGVLHFHSEWRTAPCSTPLPSICQIFPAAPPNSCMNVTVRWKRNKCLNELKKANRSQMRQRCFQVKGDLIK